MIHLPKLAARAAAIILAGGLVAVGFSVTAATAATPDPTAPRYHSDGTSWYDESQMDAVWAKVTTDYPEALPAGIGFPKDAPAFFDRDEPTVFEIGMAETIASRFWRCAWVDEALTGTPGKAAVALDKYATLPKVVGAKKYEADMAEFAEALGVTPLRAEFDVECAFYTNEKVVTK